MILTVVVAVLVVAMPHLKMGGFPSLQLHTPEHVSHNVGHLGLVVVVAGGAVVVAGSVCV